MSAIQPNPMLPDPPNDERPVILGKPALIPSLNSSSLSMLDLESTLPNPLWDNTEAKRPDNPTPPSSTTSRSSSLMPNNSLNRRIQSTSTQIAHLQDVIESIRNLFNSK